MFHFQNGDQLFLIQMSLNLSNITSGMGKTGRGVGVGDQWVKPGDGNWEIT